MNPKLDQSESLPAQDGPGKCHCQPALYMLSIKYNDYLQYSDLSKFETVPIKGRAILVLIAQSRNKSFLRPSVYAARHGEQGTDRAFNWSRLRYGARCLSGEEGWSQATHFKIQPGVVALSLCLTPLVTGRDRSQAPDSSIS